MQSRRKHSPKDIIWLRGIGWGKIPVAFMQNTHTHIEYIALSDHPKNARLKGTNDDDDDDERPRALMLTIYIVILGRKKVFRGYVCVSKAQSTLIRGFAYYRVCWAMGVCPGNCVHLVLAKETHCAFCECALWWIGLHIHSSV